MFNQSYSAGNRAPVAIGVQRSCFAYDNKYLK